MSRPLRGRPRHAARALVLTAGLALLYVVGVVSPWGQQADSTMFAMATSAGASVRAGADLLREFLVLVLGGVCVVVGVLAVRALGWRAPTTFAGIVVVSGALSVLLRDVVLLRPAYDAVTGYPQNTLPSTHVTVSAALGLAIVALWPYRSAYERVVVREVVLAVVVVTCLVNVSTFAHRPVDVLGSLLLVGIVASAAGAIAPATLFSRRRLHPLAV